MEHSQFCEHAVKQKLEGKQIAIRIALIALYAFILFAAVMLGLVWKSVLPCAVVAVLMDLSLHLLLWRRTKVEYEYSMTGGVLVFSRIYGGSARKVVFEISLREIEAAFPYEGETAQKLLEEYAPEVQYFALATQNAAENRGKEIWCCIFETDDEESKTVAFYFELTDNAYKFLRAYAGNVTANRKH